MGRGGDFLDAFCLMLVFATLLLLLLFQFCFMSFPLAVPWPGRTQEMMQYLFAPCSQAEREFARIFQNYENKNQKKILTG